MQLVVCFRCVCVSRSTRFAFYLRSSQRKKKVMRKMKNNMLTDSDDIDSEDSYEPSKDNFIDSEEEVEELKNVNVKCTKRSRKKMKEKPSGSTSYSQLSTPHSRNTVLPDSRLDCPYHLKYSVSKWTKPCLAFQGHSHVLME